MLVPNNLNEQVWQSEIEDQETLTRDALLNLNNIYIRLKHQNAPPELLEAVFDLRQKLTESFDGIRELRNCFPPNPYQAR